MCINQPLSILALSPLVLMKNVPIGRTLAVENSLTVCANVHHNRKGLQFQVVSSAMKEGEDKI